MELYTLAPDNAGELQTQPFKIRLPDAPSSQTGAVKAWEEPVVIRTYMPADPDPNPLFLEKRVNQGSSGRVYPIPVIDSVDTEAKECSWRAVHLENEYLRIMILPELGGRVHVALDKVNHYDFVYRQNVIKPALVGLAGLGYPEELNSTGLSVIGRRHSCPSPSPWNGSKMVPLLSGAAIMIRCRT